MTRTRAVLVVCLIARGQSAGAAAQDPEPPAPPAVEERPPPPEDREITGDPETLDEAFRLPTTVVSAPSTTLLDTEGMRGELLTADTFLRERTVRFLPDALEESAGVGLQRTGPAQTSPFLHGFTGFRTLMLIDGFRFNNSAWRDGPNQYLGTIDAEMVESVFVRPASGNVPLGTDAVGGSLSIHTTPAGPLLEGRDHTGRLTLRLASADRSVVTHAEAGGRLGERLLYHAGGTLRDGDDLSGGRHVGLQENTAYDENAADAKLTWLLAENADLTVAYQRLFQDDAPRTHRTIFGIDWRGLQVGDELQRDLDQFREFTYAKIRWFESVFDAAEAGIGYHVQEEDQTRVRSDLRRDHTGFTVRTLGGFVNLESVTPAGRLSYGADYYHDDVGSFAENFASTGQFTGSGIQGPVADDARYDLAGVYLEDEIELAEGLFLTVGGRYSNARLDANKVEDPATGNRIALDDHWDTWSGEVRLLDRVTENVDATLSVSRSSRIPNLSDITRLDTARSSEIETPSPGLDPEKFTTVEAGMRRTGQVSAGFTTYYTWIEDLIDRFPTGNIVAGDQEVQKANVSRGHVFGADVLVDYQFHEDWVAGVLVSYVAGRSKSFEAPGVESFSPLSKLPPLRGQMRLRWTPAETVWIEGLLTVADEQDRLSSGDQGDTTRIPPGGTPGYTVWTLRGGFRPLEHLDVTLAVENLTDVDYRLHGSGINEPGTSAVLGLRYTF